MRVPFAHLRERSTTGGWINFAVFDADSTNRTSTGRNVLLNQLTSRVRSKGLRVEQSALAFVENGQIRFFGDNNLVKYLSQSGVPDWTHTLEV